MFIVGTRLHAYSTVRCLPGTSSSTFAVLSVQTRGISRRARSKKAQARMNSMIYKNDEETRRKPSKGQSGAFMPMSANQLKDKILTETKSTLKLDVFGPETVAPQNVGVAMEFMKSENDIFRAYGVPRNLLVEFRLLSKPCSVIRDITVSTIGKLNAASKRSSLETRAVLTGPRGCGKSMLLLQAVEYCVANGWIVLYIPRGMSLVNSSTQYAYDARTRTYVQSAFSQELLRRFAQVNAATLKHVEIGKDFAYGKISFRSGTPLIELVKYATETDQSAAPAVLDTLLYGIGHQQKNPVLLAVDDIQALYRHTSLYRDPHFEGIKPYHLSVPRLLLEYASGKKHFERGAVLGALSCSDTVFSLPLELREALNIPHDRPTGPYVRRQLEFIEYAKGLQNIPVPAQLQVGEAASLYQVWRKDQALHSPFNDEVFMATYTQASGNARDFVWKGLLSSFTL